MATQRYGLLAFISVSAVLLVWLMQAPNMQAQTQRQVSASGSLSYAPSQASHSTLAYTFDITFTPSFTGYLPLISKPEATGTITGQITYQGAPSGGISVRLYLFHNPTSYTGLLTTTTQPDGKYQFNNVPDLGSNYYYRVRYSNSAQSPNYVFACAGKPIFSFPAGASAPGGNFEISDIILLAPANDATISPPYVFQWTRRVTQSDDYSLDIEGQSAYWQSNQLGYVGQYTLNSLAGTNLTTGTPNTWSVSLDAPDGSGCSARESRTVTFTNTSLLQFPLSILAWHVESHR